MNKHISKEFSLLFLVSLESSPEFGRSLSGTCKLSLGFFGKLQGSCEVGGLDLPMFGVFVRTKEFFVDTPKTRWIFQHWIVDHALLK